VLTNADSAQASTNPFLFSPYEQSRTKSYSDTDVPHVFALSANYDLPFGRGRAFGGGAGTALNLLIGGWQLAGITRWNAGTPLGFRSSFCNVPAPFAVSCVPGTIPGREILAQQNSEYNPNLPRFNRDAFESSSQFNFAYGGGSRYINVRNFRYFNQDLSLYKNISVLPENRLYIQLRFEAFNVFNNHVLSGWVTDITNPQFGAWTGGVSPPRNLQLGAKVVF
jgi:hypothetical protein